MTERARARSKWTRHVWQVQKRRNGLYEGGARQRVTRVTRVWRGSRSAGACQSGPPERASLWSAGVSVVCSLSGRRWPHSARSGARGHALRETLAPQPWQRLGHRGRPSGPVPRVVAGAPRPEVTAGVALSPSLSPRDGILSLAVSDVLRGPGRAGLGRSAHAHAGTGRADPEAGSHARRLPAGGACARGS